MINMYLIFACETMYRNKINSWIKIWKCVKKTKIVVGDRPLVYSFQYMVELNQNY